MKQLKNSNYTVCNLSHCQQKTFLNINSVALGNTMVSHEQILILADIRWDTGSLKMSIMNHHFPPYQEYCSLCEYVELPKQMAELMNLGFFG